MDLSKPLSDQEFEELDEFLKSKDMRDQCMDISMLDGFLTSVIIGPNLVMPSQWLPQVSGESPEQPMNWKSVSQAERMTGLVMRHMNDIIWQLDNDPEHYEPLVYEREHEGQTIPIIDEWCTGFIRGTLLEGKPGNPCSRPMRRKVYCCPSSFTGPRLAGRKSKRIPSSPSVTTNSRRPSPNAFCPSVITGCRCAKPPRPFATIHPSPDATIPAPAAAERNSRSVAGVRPG